MKSYCPMARTKFKPHDLMRNKLWTYTPLLKLEDAYMQFFLWANCYQNEIVHAWVEVYEDGKKVDVIDYFKDEDAVRRLDEAEQREQAEIERQKAKREASMSSPVSSSTPSKDRCDVTSDGVTNGKGE